jgi:hypothetical protein
MLELCLRFRKEERNRKRRVAVYSEAVRILMDVVPPAIPNAEQRQVQCNTCATLQLAREPVSLAQG